MFTKAIDHVNIQCCDGHFGETKQITHYDMDIDKLFQSIGEHVNIPCSRMVNWEKDKVQSTSPTTLNYTYKGKLKVPVPKIFGKLIFFINLWIWSVFKPKHHPQ